jgi:rhodanese-related sulfurtransferase
VKPILREGLAVAIIGVVFAFAANSVSPKGLKLSTNYFLSDLAPTNSVVVTNLTLLGATNALAALKAELIEKGLSLADSNLVSQLFRDPKYPIGLVAFVDARNDKDYEAGHVPGAYLLDHYRPEKYLPAFLLACNLAEKIVVYCSGGDCIDSKETAFLLSQTVPKERLLVYLGGFTEWTTNQMPVEIGDRNSGKLRGTNSPAQSNPAK